MCFIPDSSCLSAPVPGFCQFFNQVTKWMKILLQEKITNRNNMLVRSSQNQRSASTWSKLNLLCEIYILHVYRASLCMGHRTEMKYCWMFFISSKDLFDHHYTSAAFRPHTHYVSCTVLQLVCVATLDCMTSSTYLPGSLSPPEKVVHVQQSSCSSLSDHKT